jgi:hypothetical protein
MYERSVVERFSLNGATATRGQNGRVDVAVSIGVGVNSTGLQVATNTP